MTSLTSTLNRNVAIESYDLEYDFRALPNFYHTGNINYYKTNRILNLLDEPRFNAKVIITFNVTAPNENFVVLNSKNLLIGRSSLYKINFDSKVSTQISDFKIKEDTEKNELTLESEELFDLFMGYRLTIEFSGVISKEKPHGIYYRQEFDGHDGLIQTQFSPNFAKNAFPCFDEPNFTAKFGLKLFVPKELEVVAGTEESLREQL